MAAPAVTLWARLDPRARAAVALVWSLGLVLLPAREAALLLPVPLLLALTSGAGGRTLARSLVALALLWALSVLANGWLSGGDRVGPDAWGWMRPSREGLAAGMAQGARLAGLAAVSVWVFATTGLFDLAGGLEWGVRHHPRLRRLAHRVITPLVLGCRLIPAMAEEARRLQAVQDLRPRAGGPLQGVRRLAGLAPAWVRLIVDRAEALAEALELRGYDPNRPRGFSRTYRWSAFDTGVTLALAAPVFLLWVR